MSDNPSEINGNSFMLQHIQYIYLFNGYSHSLIAVTNKSLFMVEKNQEPRTERKTDQYYVFFFRLGSFTQ